jgi:DNA-binding HxlR family transcriptional regulator
MRAADPPPSKPVKGKEFKKPKQAPAADASAGGDDGGGKGAVLRRIAAELAVLRADVDALQRAAAASPAGAPGRAADTAAAGTAAVDGAALAAALRGALQGVDAPDAALCFAVAYHANGGDGGNEAGDAAPAVTSASRQQIGLAALLEAATDERVARVAYALASPPKVALIRSLLEHGPRSAARLAERTGLSTGSLYHHLRELVHAEVVWQSARNQYALTPLGYQASLLLFALAGAAGETAAAP